MRKDIYAHFENIEKKELKKVLDFLQKECGGLDKFDVVQADKDNDLDGFLEFLKNEYGVTVPVEVLLTEKEAVKVAERKKAVADKEEQERLIKDTTEKLMEQYEDISEVTDSPKFKLARRFLRLCCLSKLGLVMVGKQGTGKSTLIRAVLEEEKIDYRVQSTATTYLDLLRFLWENKNRQVVILEDVAGLWDSDKINSLMRQMLGNVNEDKLISKGTPDYRVRDIDDNFPFLPNVIIVCNEIKNRENPVVKAILDRCAKPLNISLTNKELMMMFRVIISRSKSLTISQKDSIIKFIESNSSEATEMSLRTIHKIMEYFNKDEMNWKLLAMHELSVNPIKQLILKIKDSGYATTSDEVSAFQVKAKEMGLPSSRATFFNYCKEMKPNTALAEV